jgi:transcriptional regulator with XRE-family HTH domain
MGGVVVFVISSVGKKLFEKLRKKAYRHAYMAEHVRRGIAYQIRALRDQRGWNQGTLSKELDKPQSVVCRLEDPSYGKVTVQTLLAVANVYDVALLVKFVSYSSFLKQTRDTSTASMMVPNFEDELSKSQEFHPTVTASALEAFLKMPEQVPPAHGAATEDQTPDLISRLGSMAKPDPLTALLSSHSEYRMRLHA